MTKFLTLRAIQVISLGCIAVAFASEAFTASDQAASRWLSVEILAGLRGSSTQNAVVLSQSCNDLNAQLITTNGGPGQPSATVYSGDACGKTPGKTCVECGDAPFTGTDPGFVGPPAPPLIQNQVLTSSTKNSAKPGYVLNPRSVQCGEIYYGRCVPDGNGGWECPSSDGSASGACAVGTVYPKQSVIGNPGLH